MNTNDYDKLIEHYATFHGRVKSVTMMLRDEYWHVDAARAVEMLTQFDADLERQRADFFAAPAVQS